MSLGENIRVRRTACGYTVEELANRLGVSRQTVFRYENGQIATVPSDKLQLLSEILNTTPAQGDGWFSFVRRRDFAGTYRH